MKKNYHKKEKQYGICRDIDIKWKFTVRLIYAKIELLLHWCQFTTLLNTNGKWASIM